MLFDTTISATLAVFRLECPPLSPRLGSPGPSATSASDGRVMSSSPCSSVVRRRRQEPRPTLGPRWSDRTSPDDPKVFQEQRGRGSVTRQVREARRCEGRSTETCTRPGQIESGPRLGPKHPGSRTPERNSFSCVVVLCFAGAETTEAPFRERSRVEVVGKESL